MKPYLVILYLIICVVLGASADALYFDGNKLLSHSLGSLETGLLLMGALVFKLERKHWLAFIVSYVTWRIVGFDITYNLVAGLPWNHIGTTSLWDKFFSKYAIDGWIWVKFIALILAVSTPIKYITCK